VNGWLRRLGMRIRGARHMRRRARGYHPGARHVKVDCLPRTPRAAARCEQCGSRDRALIGDELMCARCGAVPVSQWEPRVARWVRLTCPLPDDTVFLAPVPAAMVLDLMARGFAWDP
jgi:hypothetical protein